MQVYDAGVVGWIGKVFYMLWRGQWEKRDCLHRELKVESGELLSHIPF